MPKIMPKKKTPAPPKKAPAKAAKKVAAPAPAKSAAKAAKAPAKKVAAKKAPEKKTVAKKAVKKTTAPESKALGGQGLPRNLDERGFVKGSDSAKIAEVLVGGGADRNDINAKIRKALGNKTETVHGNRYNVSSAVAAVLNKMTDMGWTVDSHWVLSPPTPASKRAATRRKSKQATGSDAKVAKRVRKG